LFMGLGANEALARVWPALLAALSALCFYALRDRLTRGGALAAAALWAISPLAVFTARQGLGDGLTPALALAFLACANLAAQRTVLGTTGRTGADGTARAVLWPILTAATLGLLLATGPAAYTVVTISLAAAIYWRAELGRLWPDVRAAGRSIATAGITALAFGATCFFLAPAGLAAAADLAGAWLSGLAPLAGEYGAWDVLRRLLLSEPLALGFGIAGLIVAARRRERFGLFAGLATGVVLLVAVVGQGRHPMALGLVVLDLVILGGPAVAAAVRGVAGWRGQADPWFLVALELILIATAAQCVPGVFNSTNKADWLQLYTALGIITSVLAILLWLIYGVFGNWRTVAEALPVVLLIVGLAWGVSQLSGANYDRGAGRMAGVLLVTPDSGGLADLRRVLRELAALKGAGGGEARLDLALPESARATLGPILRWELRHLPNLRIVSGPRASMPRPPLVITAADPTAAPGETYGGADFAVLRRWRPEELKGAEAWVRWLIYREVRETSEPQKVVLWLDRAQPDADGRGAK
ncbi:MAG: hypothetical protein QG637_52, partial [Chloroflexota bacterium]|nr:hypothetical protein [Chloroflexota bacterium]